MDWNSIIDTHGNAFILYARQWTRSHADAEDIVQTAILRLCRDGAEDIPIGRIYGSIRYRALDMIRANARRSAREDTAAEMLYGQPMFEHDCNGGLSDAVETALIRLPKEQREVVIMKVWSDMSFREISEALDLRINTVASRYRYAVAKLRKSLSIELASTSEIPS